MNTAKNGNNAIRTFLTLIGALFVTARVYAEEDLGQKIRRLVQDLSSVKQGEVLQANNSEVYISLGQRHGVAPGYRFEIIRQGSPLTIDGKTVGYEESKIALVKIDTVRDGISIGKILVKKEAPKTHDKAYELRKPIKRMVVAQFSDNQGFNRLTKSLQDKLITTSINRGVQVVERDQLEKVLAEQKLGYSGLVNIESAKKIGELLGADAMLLGTISDLGNNVSINARIVDMESGDSLTAAETELPKTPLIVQLRGMPVGGETSSSKSPIVYQRPQDLQRSSKGGEFSDDFKIGPDPDWESVSGQWTMANGKFVVETNRKNQPYSVYLSRRRWKNLKMFVRVNAGNGVRHKYADICPRSFAPRDKICFRLGTNSYGGFNYSGWIITRKGKEQNLVGKTEQKIERNKSIEVVIDIIDGVYTAYIDGMLVSSRSNKTFAEGGVGFGIKYIDDFHKDFRPITFDDVRVTPIN